MRYITVTIYINVEHTHTYIYLSSVPKPRSFIVTLIILGNDPVLVNSVLLQLRRIIYNFATHDQLSSMLAITCSTDNVRRFYVIAEKLIKVRSTMASRHTMEHGR